MIRTIIIGVADHWSLDGASPSRDATGHCSSNKGILV